MGTSTDAILAYGIQLGGPEEGDELPWDEDEDTEDFIRDRYGAPEELEWADEKEDPKQHQRWSDRLSERRKFDEENIPVEIEIHCHINYPLYTLIIKKSRLRAWRGSPVEFDPSGMVSTEEWDEQLKEACEKLDIEYEQPKWWLQSYWG